MTRCTAARGFSVRNTLAGYLRKGMEVAPQLSCACNPGKVYASAASYRNHLRCQRHRRFAQSGESRDLRVRLGRAEREIARLQARVKELLTLLHRPRRRKVGAAAKKRVAARQKWSCAACQTMLTASYEVDHIEPVYLGGSNDPINLQALCPECHRCKTQRDRDRIERELTA